MAVVERSALPRKDLVPLRHIIDREARRRRRRHAIGWALLFALPLVVALAWIALRPRPIPMSARFRAQVSSQGDVLREVHATGHVEAVTTVLVGAEISGRIATVEVDFNDVVKAGQVLARFDRKLLEAQLAQVQATVAAAKSTLDQAKVDAEQRHRDLARAEALLASGAITQVNRDDASSAAKLADERVIAATSELAAQQAALTVAKTNLDHTVIVAPIDGIVITRNVDPGQTVASVLQTPVLFSVAADLKKMRVVAAVDEADVGEVAVGQKAQFTVNAYPDRVFDGVVTEVRNSPVIVQDVVTYGTVVEVGNPDLALKPGMTATVRVRTAESRGVVRVPNAALHFTPPGETTSATPAVWLLEGATLRRVEVRPGVSDGMLTEIAPNAIGVGTPVLVELTPEGKKAYGLLH